MMRALMACLLVVACGGGTPSPDTADEAGSEDEMSEGSARAESEGSGSDEEASEGASGEGDESPASASSDEDLRSVLQLVIDDEELDPHLKLGQAGRFPLKIAGPGLPDGLVKATKPVVIVAEPSGKEPVLVFTEISVKGKEANVRYRYDAENMQGSAVLKKGPHGWELLRSRVVERTGVKKD